MSYYGRNRETILAKSQAKRDAKRLADRITGLADKVTGILTEPVPLLLGLSSHISGRRIISKEDALYWGEKRYFTGVPCARGHLAQRTVSGSHCLECRKIIGRRHHHSKEPSEVAKYRRWCLANPEDLKVKQRVLQRRYGRAYYSANREEILESARLYRKKYAPSPKARYLSKEVLNSRVKRWRKYHPDLRAYHDSVRRGRKEKATPKWLTKQHHEEIKAFYTKASHFTALTGVKHVVDHIYPIKGRGYRGLHVPWNLQVITSTENSKKKNKDPSQWSRLF